ncbi:MAG: aconitate hydratase [Thermodesulfovibrionales bacterium]|nr:aconitate hydratase [Thermodesulfovibrionales bacterium]
MGLNIVEKIFSSHLIKGNLKDAETIALKVDQVYTQDATGTMAWLEFEAIGLDRVKVPLAVSYVDHNMQQSDFMNADDHLFLQTAAQRYGAYFSKPGNGICHQTHLENFAKPGLIAIGTDSHTPTQGGIGMIAIGVGGLEAATVMAGSPLEINMPKVVKVNLKGKLKRPYVTAMDVILTILKLLTVKGGVGKILEYGGEGVKDLSVPERATITNMGAELGATTSIFPSDEKTRLFLRAQNRETDWIELKADDDAQYYEHIEINLSNIEPMIACPHSPDNVKPISELEGLKVNQVCIGSCTNSSYEALKTVALILRDNKVHEDVNLMINPGSRQVFEMIAREGLITPIIESGARLLEISCGPCIGMGSAPGSGQVSVRSYNRNFKGRSGTKDANVYLTNPIACAIFAIKGMITDIFKSGIDIPIVSSPERFYSKNALLIPPSDKKDVKVLKGPNIKDVPIKKALEDTLEAEVILKTADNITTDDIMPAGSKILPLRSNIPAISEFVFSNLDETFSKRAIEAKERGGFIIIGGENYGQGSSREHAAIAPMYLGLQAVIAKSFARIHRSNLINFGVLPLVFQDASDYEKIRQGDVIRIENILEILNNSQVFTVEILNRGFSFKASSNLNEREKQLIIAGGLLPFSRRVSS